MCAKCASLKREESKHAETCQNMQMLNLSYSHTDNFTVGCTSNLVFSYITTLLPITIQTCTYWLSQKTWLVLPFVQDWRNHAGLVWLADTPGSRSEGVPRKERIISGFHVIGCIYTTLTHHNNISQYNIWIEMPHESSLGRIKWYIIHN